MFLPFLTLNKNLNHKNHISFSCRLLHGLVLRFQVPGGGLASSQVEVRVRQEDLQEGHPRTLQDLRPLPGKPHGEPLANVPRFSNTERQFNSKKYFFSFVAKNKYCLP